MLELHTPVFTMSDMHSLITILNQGVIALVFRFQLLGQHQEILCQSNQFPNIHHFLIRLLIVISRISIKHTVCAGVKKQKNQIF